MSLCSLGFIEDNDGPLDVHFHRPPNHGVEEVTVRAEHDVSILGHCSGCKIRASCPATTTQDAVGCESMWTEVERTSASLVSSYCQSCAHARFVYLSQTGRHRQGPAKNTDSQLPVSMEMCGMCAWKHENVAYLNVVDAIRSSECK